MVCGGACAGALLRWLANILLNPLFPALPPGTLAANWLGSFIMGMALTFFALLPQLGQEWKLLLVTGFLGSFTTFSAFAGEMASLIQQSRYLACAGGICLHVFGSLLLVFAGMALAGWILKS